MTLSIKINAKDILVYVNGELIVTYTAVIEFKPDRYDIKTQTDQSTVKYLNSEMRYKRFFLTKFDFPLKFVLT